MNNFKNKLKVLTWHVHGSYLYYLTQTNCIFYVPVTHPHVSGYMGKTKGFAWGDNVIEVEAEDVKELDLDCILFQSNFDPANPDNNFLEEQTEILSKHQIKTVPKLFLEHDPPRKHPTDTRHLLYNSTIPLIHVTEFNRLMWDSGTTPTHVIDHGVLVPSNNLYTGEIERGIVVVNNLHKRGRRLGLDIFEQVKKEIPLDLVGIGSEKLGGLGEVPPKELPAFIGRYRFFFSPSRYTSLGLSILEAMMIGMPIVGLATTELSTVIDNDKNGYIHTDINFLIKKMKLLLKNTVMAKQLGKKAKKTAKKRFAIERFAQNWGQLFEKVISTKTTKEHLRRYPLPRREAIEL